MITLQLTVKTLKTLSSYMTQGRFIYSHGGPDNGLES
jgi:hypothetical protein